MKQKFIAIAAALLLVTVGASAQTYVNAGYGTTDKITTIDNLDPATLNMATWYVGLSHNISLPYNLGIEVGLNYYNSSNSQEMTTLENSSVDNKENGLMIPVDVNYTIGIGNLLSITAFAGPTFYYGLNNNTTTILNGKQASVIDKFEKETEAPFMTTATFGASVNVASFRVKVAYQCGLNNVGLTDYTTIDKNIFTVGIGYRF